jgi:hypothetical protein
MSSLTRLGVRFGRHTATYASGSAVSLVLGFASFAILTRFLAPDEFGVLAVLLLFSALLTVLYPLGLLQGAFAWVFGSSGEEETDDSRGARPDDSAASDRAHRGRGHGGDRRVPSVLHAPRHRKPR